ncbi:unnamed protein product [marine sediment metagenome]|uniref:Uncharacterized protein n=1 Tax=marine sediment metagenome TaxID=412755 RepID=X1CQP3_9ZZZZ
MAKPTFGSVLLFVIGGKIIKKGGGEDVNEIIVLGEALKWKIHKGGL